MASPDAGAGAGRVDERVATAKRVAFIGPACAGAEDMGLRQKDFSAVIEPIAKKFA